MSTQPRTPPRSATRRSRGGYMLVETMAGGAILVIMMLGLSTGLLAGTAQVGRATVDQEAANVAMKELERLRALSSTASAWAVGAPIVAAVPAHPTWTLTTAVSAVSDAAVSAPVGTLTYKRAQVTVTYAGRTFTLETFRW